MLKHSGYLHLVTLSLVTLLIQTPVTSIAQAPVDYIKETPSNSHFYYENLGQLTDNNGHIRDDIKYYTEHTSPALYIAPNNVSFTYYQQGDSLAQDTTYRIDMQFLCDGPEGDKIDCAKLSVYDKSQDYLNYYLPHCASGITNVSGYAGVVYTNAFPDIDVHFSSNNMGLKNYIVLKPGADPTDIHFKFTGQDSIAILANTIALYLGDMGVVFPDATAYQYDASGNLTPLGWLPVWTSYGGGVVNLSLGSYDNTQNLYIRFGLPAAKGTAGNGNMDWSTFYGSSSQESFPVLCTSTSNVIYHALSQTGGIFPASTGLQTTNHGNSDMYISCFGNDATRAWATYYGGSRSDQVTAMAEYGKASTDFGSLYITGYTQSNTDLPFGSTTPSNFKRTTYAGGLYDGVLLNINKSGYLIWSTYFGGDAQDEIHDIFIDDAHSKLYITGLTWSANTSTSCTSTATSTDFPVCQGTGSRFFQSSNKGMSDAFISEFDITSSNLIMEWSTLWGGENQDIAWGLTKVTSGDECIYVTGITGSTNSASVTGPISSYSATTYPIVDPGTTNAYVQYNRATGFGTTATITKFDKNYKMEWSSYFGGDKWDRWKEVAVNSAHDVYVIGSTTSTGSTSNSMLANNSSGSLKLPIYYTGSSYHQSRPGATDQDMFIARFSSDNVLKWCTTYGGTGNEYQDPAIAIDENDNVFAGGPTVLKTSTLGNIPIPSGTAVAGRYNQATNASTGQPYIGSGYDGDAYILQFNADNDLIWATNFGGYSVVSSSSDPNPADNIASMAIGGTGNTLRLYVSGTTSCTTTPNWTLTGGINPYNDASYNMGGDVFISRFSNPGTTSVKSNHKIKGFVNVYPNPSRSVFNVIFIPKQTTGNDKMEVSVMNLLGQHLFSYPVTITPGPNKFSIELKNKPAGLYLLHLNFNGEVYSEKLILN